MISFSRDVVGLWRIPGKKLKLAEIVKEAIHVGQTHLHFFFTPLSLHTIVMHEVKGLEVLFTVLQFQIQFQKEIHALHLFPDTFLLIFSIGRSSCVGIHHPNSAKPCCICHDPLATACGRHSAFETSQNCKWRTLTALTIMWHSSSNNDRCRKQNGEIWEMRKNMGEGRKRKLTKLFVQGLGRPWPIHWHCFRGNW